MRHYFVDIHTHQPHPDVVSPRMAGIHPWDAEKGLPLPDFSECDIIGETGLDYACKVNREAQAQLFRAHLAAAQRLSLPVVLHVVRSFEDVMHILAEYPKVETVVFHGFIGSEEQAKRCFERGYYLSFGERSLRSQKSRHVIASAPRNRIFCESDDNPSSTIEGIYREVAALRNESLDELCSEMAKNYERLIIKR